MNEFESCLRRDYVMLEFHNDFMIWAIEQDLNDLLVRHELSFYCMGWEL